jgi:D-alanine-D-alanine ligase
MRKLRILVLMHESLVPPASMEGYTDKQMQPWKTEFDVVATLRDAGHEVLPLGVSDEVGPIRAAVKQSNPHVTFNLLEEFHSVGVYDHYVVSYLELLRQRYTGCNPRGLMIAHDKALSKQILTYHRIPTPGFFLAARGRRVVRPKRLGFPLLVKSVVEDASLGIAQASVVHNDEKLAERVGFVHDQFHSDAIVEEYIEGRELYVGVIGNQRLQTLPVWEMLFTNMPEGVPHIATAKVKWDFEYQKRCGIKTRAARDLPPGAAEGIARLCKRVYRALYLSGYARMDLRLAADGRIYVLEANPNPNLAYGEDFAESAETVGVSYEALLQRIIGLGMRYSAPWTLD